MSNLSVPKGKSKDILKIKWNYSILYHKLKNLKPSVKINQNNHSQKSIFLKLIKAKIYTLIEKKFNDSSEQNKQ